MKQFKQTYSEIIYGYTPGEFLPIFIEGKMSNMNEFRAYKAKKAAAVVGHGMMQVVEYASAVQERLYKM